MPDNPEQPKEDPKVPTSTEAPTSTAVARLPTEQELAQRRGQREHNEALAFGLSGREEYIALRDSIAKGAEPAEFKMFLLIAKRLGLSPVGGQIHFIKRATRIKENGQWRTKDVFTAQVGIDGFRAIAQDTKEYEGPYGLPTFRYADNPGVWTDEEKVDADGKPVPPIAARVGVWHKGWKEPVLATALYASYVQTKASREDSGGDGGYGGSDEPSAPKRVPNATWAKMPHLMLAKCAEAMALRKAFPAQLGGVYSTDEMGQAQNDVIEGDYTEPAGQAPAANGATEPAPQSTVSDTDAKALEQTQIAAVDALNDSLPRGTKWMGPMLKAKKDHLGLRGAFQDRVEAHVKVCGPECDHLKAITGEVTATKPETEKGTSVAPEQTEPPK